MPYMTFARWSLAVYAILAAVAFLACNVMSWFDRDLHMCNTVHEMSCYLLGVTLGLIAACAGPMFMLEEGKRSTGAPVQEGSGQ